jgi:hypothetical protein
MREARVHRLGQCGGERINPVRNRLQALEVLLRVATALGIANNVEAFAQGSSQVIHDFFHKTGLSTMPKLKLETPERLTQACIHG